MYPDNRMLSVLDISQICDVARSTASYWITNKGLSAQRSGNKFLVCIKDLIFFLETIGRPVPQTLLENNGGVSSYPFKTFRNCWEYWQNDRHGENCVSCSVCNYQVSECFTLKTNKKKCSVNCSVCRYYYEHYTQYTAFIHQLPMPAAVLKDMYIWSGNSAWSELCGIDMERLIGIGIEEIVHPESIKTIINFNKKIKQEENREFFKSRIFFEGSNGKKVEVVLGMACLNQPRGAYFAVSESGLAYESGI